MGFQKRVKTATIAHQEKRFHKMTSDNNASPPVEQETHHLTSPTPKLTERCETRLSMMSNGQDCCRICQCDVCEIDEDSPLIAPCLCDGSMRYIHQACLQQWIKSSEKEGCELCKYEYKMTSSVKPFRK